MDEQQVFMRLCYYDKRNPDNVYHDTDRAPRTHCYCDNCFYGRDALALEILRLRKLLNM